MYNNIVVIDDAEIDRFISMSVIKKNTFASHSVAFSEVADGLVYLKSKMDEPEQWPEVIFLDVNLPLMDGFDFLDNYMQLPEDVQRRSKIFMMSATQSDSDLEKIKTYPMVCKLFNKPLTKMVLEEVNAFMEMGQGAI